MPTSLGAGPELVAHTVLDRNLVRAGETVSMKHSVRQQTLQGLALPQDWPAELVITHVGSGQQYKQSLQWAATHNGGRNAISSFVAGPAAAKLGLYTVELRWPAGPWRPARAAVGAVPGGGLPPAGVFKARAARGQGRLVQPSAIPVAGGS